MRKANKYERRHAHRLIWECVRLLESRKWRIVYIDMEGRPWVCDEFGLDADAVGTVIYEEMTVYIDFRHDVIATVLHELLHVIYPKKPERDIRRLEGMLIHHLTPEQAVRIHRLMVPILTAAGSS